jgi:hypothetical protein
VGDCGENGIRGPRLVFEELIVTTRLTFCGSRGQRDAVFGRFKEEFTVSMPRPDLRMACLCMANAIGQMGWARAP